MIRNILYILILLITGNIFAQVQSNKLIEGSVSSITSQNIYVKFTSTEGIEVGDTLFIKDKNNFLPALKVEYKSSTSCAGTSIASKKLETNTSLYACIPEKKNEDEAKVVSTTETLVAPVVIPTVASDEITTKTALEAIPTLSGRVSVQSYSNFTNNQSSYDYQRWRYTFQVNANRIGSSGFSYSHWRQPRSSAMSTPPATRTPSSP